MATKPTYEDLEQRIRDLEKETLQHEQAMQVLSVSAGQKKAILDGITTNLAFVNENLEVIWTNSASARSIGKKPSELIGRKCHELWADPETPCEGCPTVKAFKTRKSEQKVIQTPDGRVWDEKGEPVFDENGALLGVLEIAHDITKGKRAEDALYESERLLDATGRMARVGGWELDAETMQVSWTEEIYRIHEVPSGHKPPLEEAVNYFHPGDRDRLSSAIQRALETGEPYDMVLRFITAKGKPLWVRTVCEPEVMDGRTVKLRGTLQDITAQKEAEQALQKSEQKFRELFNSISDLIYTQDLEGRFLSANPSMCERFGYDENEFIGRKASEFMAPEVRALFETEYIGGIKKNGYYEGTAAYYGKDGEKVFVQYRSKLIEPEDADPYISGIGQDVTQRVEARKERKRLEDELLQTRKMEAIATLTGGIAHDYNNLLAIIMGNLSLAIQEAEPGSELAEFLSEAEHASEKVKTLTRELMALSKGSAPVKEVVSIVPLFKSVISALPVDSKIAVTDVISEDLWSVPHDPHKLGSVFRNVITNAVEAMPDGGNLTIGAENLRIGDDTSVTALSLKAGDYVHVTIEDQGVGIPKDHLGKLYDPYFSTKPMGVQKGMGLGLATAYANVKKHGGYMAVDSSPGKGTVVNIYLPAEPVSQAVEGGDDFKADGVPTKKWILVMEDEKMLRNLVRHMLERLGYEGITVKDGTEAIEAYRKYLGSDQPFDAVLLDLTIKGGMGGEETIRRLRKLDPNVKAIVCSGYFDDAFITDFESYGFKEAMAKPYEMKTLKETLEKLIG